jgi:fructoselysine 6-kinase
LTRICGVGDCLVDCYPQQEVMYPGGNALNVAVGAARVGATSAFVGAVGDDDAGRAVTAALRAEGVATDRLRVVAGGPTSHAVVELHDGERTFVGHDLGVSELTLDDDDLAYLSGFDLIHTGDCSVLEDELPRLAGLAPVSFDFSNRPDEYCAPLLPHVHVAVFSAGHLDPDATERLLRAAADAGPRFVLATRGAAGATLLAGGRLHHASPAPVPGPVVDTLGAGDAFIARVLVGLVAEEEVAAILAAAAEQAAASVSELGAFGHGAPLVPVASTGRKLR